VLEKVVNEQKDNANKSCIIKSKNFNISLNLKNNVFINKLLNFKKSKFVSIFLNEVGNLDEMDLSEGAYRIYTTPNQGGGSIKSEALAYQILHTLTPSIFLKATETQIEQFPSGGAMTDFIIGVKDRIKNNLIHYIGVSVTRAMTGGPKVFTNVEANILITKKLNKINSSTITINNARKKGENKMRKQILMIFSYNESYINLLKLELLKIKNGENSGILNKTFIIFILIKEQEIFKS
jgi:hypothetical protein